MPKEPTALVRGKAFHKLIQKEWEDESNEFVRRERTVQKGNGGRGRIDILVDSTEDTNSTKGVISVIEIKATDWDRIKKENINRNIRRQIKQIWDYIESKLKDKGKSAEVEGMHKDICPGIIFPYPPKDNELKEKIENDFIEYGIVVYWHGERE